MPLWQASAVRYGIGVPDELATLIHSTQETGCKVRGSCHVLVMDLGERYPVALRLLQPSGGRREVFKPTFR